MSEKKQILVAALARQVRRKWPLSRERGSIRSKPNWPKAIIPQPSRDRSSVEGGACRRRDEPEATAEKVRDRWLHIGNMTIKDRKGYVRITERLTDMIIRGAFNTYPAEIEDFFFPCHPKVWTFLHHWRARFRQKVFAVEKYQLKGPV